MEIPITDVLGPIEVLQAGIVNGEAMLSSSMGQKKDLVRMRLKRNNFLLDKHSSIVYFKLEQGSF